MVQSRPTQANEATLRTLIDEHSRQLFRLAYRMTGNEQDAEDVVQETYLRAHDKLPAGAETGQATGWLYRIATNYAIDLLRRRKRWRSADLDDLEPVSPLTSHEPDPHRSAIGSEVDRRIRAQLDTLSPSERLAFTLRHYEGMSIDAIGEVLGTRRSATKNHVFRAVRKMRKALAPWVKEAR